MTVGRPKEEFHKIAVANGYWWANRLEMTGEMLYLHESLPKFEKVMAKYRGKFTPNDRWSPGGVPHTYLLTPAWPPPRPE